jgi:transcriptional regulator with XRE-family HTH domain
MGKTKRKSELDVGVGKALRSFRVSAGLTQAQAAKALSTNQATLSNYENGVTSVSPTTLHAAFAAFQATPNEFFEAANRFAPDEEQMTKARGVLKGPNTTKRSK